LLASYDLASSATVDARRNASKARLMTESVVSPGTILAALMRVRVSLKTLTTVLDSCICLLYPKLTGDSKGFRGES